MFKGSDKNPCKHILKVIGEKRLQKRKPKINSKPYYAKTLISGQRVDDKLKGRTLVAVPYDLVKKGVKVIYMTDSLIEKMFIEKRQKALRYRRFPDQYGRDRTYTLCYFEWKPIKPYRPISLTEGLSKLPDDKKEKFLTDVRKIVYKTT